MSSEIEWMLHPLSLIQSTFCGLNMHMQPFGHEWFMYTDLSGKGNHLGSNICLTEVHLQVIKRARELIFLIETKQKESPTALA